MESCAHAVNKRCPISKETCPGVCVYSDIMENVSLGIIVCDYGRREVIFQNTTAAQIMSPIPPKDYDGLCAALLPDMEVFFAMPSPYSPEPLHYGNRILGYSVYRSSDRFMWIFLRDITEKMRLETVAEAVNSMNNIGYIFSGIRHEIGNPLNSIKMAVSLLEENIDTCPRDTIMDYLRRTMDDIGRIEYLLRSLKNFNLYENPHLENVHLPLFIERFISLIRSDFEANGITITPLLSHDAEWVYTDPRALQQVLLNLMTNAADALEEREKPRISIETYPWVQNRVFLRVRDNGRGIAEGIRKELFKPFMTDKQKGTGLGLVIVKKMLSKMASTIEIESQKDVGTSVNIILPGRNRWDRTVQEEHCLS